MVGIYSGTFDPVHEGHVAFCLAAIERVGLRRVILLPERQPRGKKQVSDFAHRAAMLKIAVQDYPQLEVAEMDDAQFTVERTLPELQRRFGRNLALLIGSDVVRTLSYRWPGLETLFREMDLVIGLRHGDTGAEIEEALHQLSKTARFQCIPSPQLHVTSTVIRTNGQAAHPDAKVRQYIATNNLYAK